MTNLDTEFAIEECGARVGEYLKQAWPAHTAKSAAQTFGVEVVTAKGWLSGRLPANRHLLAMVHRFGPAFVGFVFEPLGSWARALSVNAMVDEAERRAAEASAAVEALRRETGR